MTPSRKPSLWQQALMSAWHDDQAGTEELRTALQDYRTFWNYLANFSREP
jgi:hypothetical protein